MHYTPVTADEFAAEHLSDWHLTDGVIRADFRAGSFPDAGALVPLIAAAAQAIDHHPDIDVRFPDHVLVTLTTHDAHGLTTHDIDLARTISRLAAEAGAHAAR
ncbi:MAG: 4a-hydroxytetrahydrobiopterin dehydratase [Actinomycetota bacterium]|nr:4a-hydroxytetrahydrobiopterin dehydratase [Actinomycetota bacterium]